ncbi:hypothetical protein V6Z12_A05G050800 [Gossypium hirsutum]
MEQPRFIFYFSDANEDLKNVEAFRFLRLNKKLKAQR